jgi:F0F1-type ATP synthase membrane subunit c/vacuolar-type H+-ATPase subunit K
VRDVVGMVMIETAAVIGVIVVLAFVAMYRRGS